LCRDHFSTGKLNEKTELFPNWRTNPDRAAMRFYNGDCQPRARAGEKPVMEIGDFYIDTAARKVTVLDREVRLTPKEFELLVYMAGHPGKVMTHRALLAAVWGSQSTEQVQYLRVFVGQLRKKLEPDAASPR
jgi:DNA-binding response OmpR family regulator